MRRARDLQTILLYNGGVPSSAILKASAGQLKNAGAGQPGSGSRRRIEGPSNKEPDMTVLPHLKDSGLLAGFEALLCDASLSRDWVAFRFALVTAQRALYETLSESPGAPGSPSEAQGAVAVVNLADLPYDEDQLSGLLRDATAELQAQGREVAILSRLLAAAEAEAGLLSVLASASCRDLSKRGEHESEIDARAQALGLPADVLEFFGLVLAAPYVSVAARAGGRFAGTAEAERHGACPVCGTPAATALIVGEEGGRLLCCPLCAATYPFVRRRCPICSSSETLGVLREGEDSAHWLETCEDCNGFVRTFDTRVPGPARAPEAVVASDPGDDFFPLIAVTATLYLDLIAEEQGYRGTVPYAALR